MDAAHEKKSIRLRQRLWGAAVLIALLVIFLPLLLDGSGSESQYRRVERLRAEPPRIISSNEMADAAAPSERDSAVMGVNDASGQGSSSNQGVSALQGDQGSQGQQVGQSDQSDQSDLARLNDQGIQAQQGEQDAQASQGDRDGQAQQGDRSGQIDREEQNGQSEPNNDDVELKDVDSASDQRSNESDTPADTGQMRAWVVQAGSFSDENNAIVVRDRLRQAGHPSFVTPTDSEPPVYRVRVGPMIDLQQAESKRDEVIDYLGREAIVVSYP